MTLLNSFFFSHNELEYILNGFRDLHEKKTIIKS